MAETIVTDLKLNLGPFEQQIEAAVAGMHKYATTTETATKDNKSFENSLGSTSGKLAATKAATQGAAKATEQMGDTASEAAKDVNDLGSSASGSGNLFSQFKDKLNSTYPIFGKIAEGAKTLGRSMYAALGPIGIAIGALVIAFAGLVKIFGGTQEGMDRIRRVVEPLKAQFQAFIGLLQQIGKVAADTISLLFNLATLDFAGAADSFNSLSESASEAGEAISNFGTTLDQAAEKGARLAELKEQLEDLAISIAENESRLNREYQEQYTLASNVNATSKERRAAAEEAIRLQKELTDLKIKELDLLIEEKEIAQSLNDTTKEEYLELVKLKAARDDARAEELAATRRVQNTLNALLKQESDKRLAEAKKAADEEKKLAEQRASVEQELTKAQAAALGQRQKAEQEALDTRDARIAKAAGDAQLLIQIEQQYQADLQAIRDKAAADAEAVANKQAQALSAALLSSAQDRLDRLKQEQDIELELAKANGEDVQALLTEQYNERASLEQDIRDQRLAALEAQYQEDYAALDGNLIAQYDRLAQFEVDKATLLNESAVNELDAKRQLLEQTQELSAAEEALAQTRIDTVAGAGQIISELAGESKAAAAIGFAAQKAAAIAQVIATTNAGIAAATAAAAAIPPVLPPGIPNPAFAVAQAVSAAQIARLKITAGLSLAQILAQSVSGFDKGGIITGNEGPRIRKAGGDNVLMTGKKGEIVLNERQQRELKRKTHPMIFGDIGVPGFAKPTTTFGFAQDPEIQYRWITGLEAVNSYAEGRSVTYNNTTTTAPVKFSDKGIKGAIGQGTKEARRQTELLALMAKANRRGNRRYYA